MKEYRRPEHAKQRLVRESIRGIVRDRKYLTNSLDSSLQIYVNIKDLWLAVLSKGR